MTDPQKQRLYALETVYWAEWNSNAQGMRTVVSGPEWEAYCEELLADALADPYVHQRRRTRSQPLRFIDLPETDTFAACAFLSTDTLGVKATERKKYLAMHEVCHLLTRELRQNPHSWKFVSVYSQMIGRHISESAAQQFRGLAHSQSIQFTEYLSDVRIMA